MAFLPDGDPYPASLPTMGSPCMNPYGNLSLETAEDFFNDGYNEASLRYPSNLDAIPFTPAGFATDTQLASFDPNFYHTDDTSPTSSSDSSTQHHRHASSNSSRSVAQETAPVTPEAAHMHDLMTAKTTTAENPSKRSLDAMTGVSEDDRKMSEIFDFDSAANSPGNGTTTDTGYQRSSVGLPLLPTESRPRPTLKKITQPQKHERAQNNYTRNPLYGPAVGPRMGATAGFGGPGSFTSQPPTLTPPPLTLKDIGSSEQLTSPALIIHEIPSKTRVETQISLAMTITPMPRGITKLHLPKRTMAKPKLMAKSHSGKSPDTLELDVMPVCASAMKQPHLKHRALALARGEGLSPQSSQKLDQSLPNGKPKMEDLAQAIPPLEGGPISICEGCMTREQKRADRRTVKQESEEDIIFKQGGKDRIVIFNEAEIVEWKPYSPSTVYISTGKRAKGYPRGKRKDEAGEGEVTPTARSDIPVPCPERARNICLMMRITCYCRHQGETEGFQVILTIKDHEGKCVTQNISGPILITDDHKASGPQHEGKNAMSVDDRGLQGEGLFPSTPPTIAPPPPFHFPQSRSTNDFSVLHPHHDAHALHRSATSLQLQRHAHAQAAARNSGLSTPSNNSSYRTSTTLTPHHLSRQVSPPPAAGPNPKRRKASGHAPLVHRPLVNLSMTMIPSEDASLQYRQCDSTSPASSSEASEGLAMRKSLWLGCLRAFNLTTNTAFTTTSIGPPTQAHAAAEDTGISTLELSPPPILLSSVSASMRDVDESQPSDIGSPPHINQQPDNTMADHVNALHQSLLHLPGAVLPSAIVPRVTRVIPSEGPISGGIEVTIFGEGFYNDVDLLFGSFSASRIQLHSSQTIICLIPPSFQAGLVNVSLKGFPPPPGFQVMFRYKDTNEEDLMRLALAVQYHRTTGKFADASDIARSIINSQQSMNGSSPDQHQHLPGNNTMDLELSILGVLDVIDQADSAVPPRYNLRQSYNRQTMLHLSASLGYHRLMAGLVARGARPNLCDRNGMTPMHMACLYGRTRIVRKLLSVGGDPTIRSIQGLTPLDLAKDPHIHHLIRTFQRHVRSRSVGATPTSHLSRSSSFASFNSLHRPLFTDEATLADDIGSSSSDVVARAYRSQPTTPAQAYARSRRNSKSNQPPFFANQAPDDVATNTHLVAAAAAMTVWRDNLAGQIHQFQQSLQRTLPNLQMPNLPPMNLPPLPNFEAYQEHPMVRRISSLVPRKNSPPEPPEPPAYEEIYPDAGPTGLSSVKKASAAARAMDEALVDQKCAVVFDQHQTSSSRSAAAAAAAAGQPDEILHLAHGRKEKKLRNDRKLFFIWKQIPLLCFVMIAMTKDSIPWMLQGVGRGLSFVFNARRRA
ncbi:MAG: hypothetical protein Q9212_006385 [Teloschistes hypoglaucus]